MAKVDGGGPTPPRGRDKSGPYALAIASLGLFRALRHQYQYCLIPQIATSRTTINMDRPDGVDCWRNSRLFSTRVASDNVGT